MKREKKLVKILTMILVFLSCLLLSIIYNIGIDKNYVEDDKIKYQPPEEKIDLAVESTPIEEAIVPKYKIFITKRDDKCKDNSCITNKKYEQFKKYLEEKFKSVQQKDHQFIIKDNEYIELVQASDENDVNESNYKYVFSEKTTIDDLKYIFEGIKKPTEITKKPSTVTGNASQIAVLNYHFFYDKSNPNERKECDQSICLDVKDFEEQLKYLKDNDYKTLTMEEFRAWLYKEIELPKKSVLLTIDDGAMGTGIKNGNKLIPLLEKYQVHATLFLITGWWPKENYQSEYLDIQSHGDLIHEYQTCNGQTKTKLHCLNYQELKDDLKTSMDKLGTNTSFCYPFYSWSNTAIKVLKELDFKLAFVGGNVKAKRSDNKYKIPRYIIYKTTSLNSFINMIS